MNIKEKSVVITSAARTAIGAFRGSLKDMQAYELGSIVLKETAKKSNLKLNDVDELIMGQVLTGGTGQNPARQAAVNTCPIINSSISFNFKFDLFMDSLMTTDPSSCPCIFFKEPRNVPIAVRTAEVITTLFCSMLINHLLC